MVAEYPTSLYRYYDDRGALIYVGITGRGIARNEEHNKSKAWWPFVAHQDVQHFPSREAALAAERAAVLANEPPFNTQHNRNHKQVRAEYLRFRKAYEHERALHVYVPFTSSQRRFVWLTPVGPHLLGTLPTEAVKLAPGVLRAGPEPIVVSTPQRKRAGTAEAEMRGGLLAVHIRGQHLPDEINVGRALLKWNGNAKPLAFWVAKVMLNEAEGRK